MEPAEDMTAISKIDAHPIFSFADGEMGPLANSFIRAMEMVTGQPKIKKIYFDYVDDERPRKLFWSAADQRHLVLNGARCSLLCATRAIRGRCCQASRLPLRLLRATRAIRGRCCQVSRLPLRLKSHGFAGQILGSHGVAVKAPHTCRMDMVSAWMF